MIKCPNCGAAINRPGAVVACEYCGTSVRVQRRTGFFERAEPPPINVPKAALNLPLVVQKHSGRWVLLTALAPLLITGVVSIIIFTTVRGAQQRAANSPSTPRWDGVDSAVVRDVDGDGVEDVVGRMATRTSDAKGTIAAFSGTSGKRLWISEAVASRSDSLHTALGVTDKLVVVSNNGGEVVAFNLANGKTAWRTQLGERTKRFCADGEGSVIAELKDKSRKRLSLADGTVTSDDGANCEVLPHDDADEDGPAKRVLERHGIRTSVPKDKHFEGMSIRGAVVSPQGVHIAFGNKSPGTRSPMIARYEMPAPPEGVGDPAALEAEARTKKGREASKLRRAAREAERKLSDLVPRVAWQALVPGIPPLKAAEGAAEPEHIGINADVVAVTYKRAGGGHNYHLTAFALGDGKRLWDLKLPGTMPLSAVFASKSAVFVSRWGSLMAFDPKTGAKRWSTP